MGILGDQPLDQVGDEVGVVVAHLLDLAQPRVDRQLGAHRREDPRLQLAIVDRLGQELVGPGLDEADAILLGMERRHDDDRNVAGVRALLQPPEGLEAVHDRHHHVEQDEIGRIARDAGQRLAAVPRLHRATAQRVELLHQDIAIERLVIDDEDGRRPAHRLAPRPTASPSSPAVG